VRVACDRGYMVQLWRQRGNTIGLSITIAESAASVGDAARGVMITKDVVDQSEYIGFQCICPASSSLW